MDPATSKTCQLCNQQVYPRDIRSDGTCKACARRQYYLSRKDLLAERYRNNREQRLQKQREYYLRKKESKQNGSVKPPSADRNRRKNGNGQQRSRQQELQDYQQHMRVSFDVYLFLLFLFRTVKLRLTWSSSPNHRLLPMQALMFWAHPLPLLRLPIPSQRVLMNP